MLPYLKPSASELFLSQHLSVYRSVCLQSALMLVHITERHLFSRKWDRTTKKYHITEYGANLKIICLCLLEKKTLFEGSLLKDIIS